MKGVLLTQYSGKIVGPVAWLLGHLMNGIFNVLNSIGIPNIGLAIIIFTIVIYLCLLPLTYKQQKFSKLQAKMSPELKAIQDKYKGKKDNDSMLAMQAETKEVYAKYGVSQTGSCLQLLIQMPILFALYRVIYTIPAYVTIVKNSFSPLVEDLMATNGASDFLQTLSSAAAYKKQFSSEAFVSGDDLTDTANKTWGNWTNLIKKFYNQTRLKAAGVQLGIMSAVNVGIVLIMGFMVWVLTRGKNNPYRLFNVWECYKIVFWAALTPAVLTSGLGFLIKTFASTIFPLLLGVRVMWLSMKSLRPDGSGYAAN